MNSSKELDSVAFCIPSPIYVPVSTKYLFGNLSKTLLFENPKKYYLLIKVIKKPHLIFLDFYS
jgi:hypothetical protein